MRPHDIAVYLEWLTDRIHLDSRFVMDKIKIIHVGLGRWGSDWARHIYPESADAEVVGYVDQDPLALERPRQILGVSPARFFPLLSDAIAEVDAEAVVITLPLSLHAF